MYTDCGYLVWLWWKVDRGGDLSVLLTVIVGCRGGASSEKRCFSGCVEAR